MSTNADGRHRRPVLARAGAATQLWMNPAL
jgi:hypothetical protein